MLPLASARALLAALVLVLLPGAAAAQSAPDRWILVRVGALLMVPGEDPLREATVVVHDGLVEAVRREYVDRDDLELPDDAEVEVIDLREHFVMPGLIDSHTHITSEYTAGVRLQRLQESEADAALHGVVYARRTLEAGFTTIRDVGSSGDAVFALRDAIESGEIPGPRILAAGEGITPTGGHGDDTVGFRDDLFDVPGPERGVCDGTAECRKAVRAQVRRGADLIKLTATGGVLSAIAAGTEQQFFADELETIVDTAHLLGKKVAAHGHGAAGINAALAAGVDSIEHGTFLDEESIRLFKQTGAFLVPTIIAGKTVEERAKQPGYYPPPVVEKALRVGPQIQKAFARAYEAGVRIAFGTDAGVFDHGDNAREFAYMVEAGMSEMDALVSATSGAAELLGLEDRIGTLEPGKAADMIATERNPLVDISELQRVVFVMRDGVVYRAP